MDLRPIGNRARNPDISTMSWSRSGIPMMLLPMICGVPAFAAPKPWTLDAIMDLKTGSDPQITAGGWPIACLPVAERRDVAGLCCKDDCFLRLEKSAAGRGAEFSRE
jgi:hypothetical protein